MINATCIGSDFQHSDTTTTTTNVAVSLMPDYIYNNTLSGQTITLMMTDLGNLYEHTNKNS